MKMFRKPWNFSNAKQGKLEINMRNSAQIQSLKWDKRLQLRLRNDFSNSGKFNPHCAYDGFASDMSLNHE